jgi:hypothetical protein
MATQQTSDWFKTFMDHLRGLIKEPPYLTLFFVSTILVIISLFRPIQLYTFLAVFFYSIFGLVWRHAVKDMRGKFKDAYPNKYVKIDLWLTATYHFVNLIVVVLLIVVIVRYLTVCIQPS